MKKYMLITLLFLFSVSVPTVSAYIQDNSAGSWISNVTSTSDFPTRTNTSVNTTNGLMLTNSSDGFRPPYRMSGYAITPAITPQSVIQWGILNVIANIPNETSIRIQVMGREGSNIIVDNYLPGNSQGFTNMTLNLSGLPVFIVGLPSNDTSNSKIAMIRFKFLFETNNTNVTPSISYINFTWKPRSDILPEPSLLASSGWPTYYGNSRFSNFNPGYNESDYYIVRWVSTTFPSVFMLSTRPLIFNNSIITESWYRDSHLYSIDKDYGSVKWNINFGSMSCAINSITESGMLYTAEYCNDIFIAVDIKTGEPKWSYYFAGGHGNGHVAIDDNGILYTTRYSTTSLTETLYAFYPNGTVKYTSIINVSNVSVGLGTSGIAINNGTLYFAIYTYNDSTYEYLNTGKLFAINPANGSVIWTYDTSGTYNVLIDSSGTIYTYWYDYENTTEKKILAVYPNATLKWERSMGYNTGGWSENPSIRDDQTMISVISPIYDSGDNTTVEKINLTDGSVISSGNLGSDSYYYFVFDGAGNFYFQNYSTGEYGLDKYDSDYNFKWKMLGPKSIIDNDISYGYSFGGNVIDERGWVYGSLGYSVYNETDYSRFDDFCWAKAFALAPWTMSASASSDRYYHGGEIGFTVKTSMAETNLLLNGSNEVQVYLDNGDKVELVHSSDSNDGDTIWTGSYTIPSNMTLGAHTFAAEAGATWFQTDIATHFDSPANYTNNTGINVTGAFSVVARPSASNPAPSDSSGRTFGYLVFNPTPKQIEEGNYHEVLYKGWSVVFNIGGETHGLVVENITSLGALITIMSAPQQAFMSVGEERMFEVDGDDYYDVYVRLNSINGNGVNTTIKSVHEKIVTEPSPETNEPAPEEVVARDATPESDKTTDSGSVPQEAAPREDTSKTQSSGVPMTLAAVIAVAVVLCAAVAMNALHGRPAHKKRRRRK
jgi:hypothetical protein